MNMKIFLFLLLLSLSLETFRFIRNSKRSYNIIDLLTTEFVCTTIFGSITLAMLYLGLR